MKKPVLIIISCAVFIIILLSIAQTVLSNALSTSGVLMGKITDQTLGYKTENALLREKFFLLSSLNNLASRASELGFVEGKSQFVVTKSLPLAVRQ